MALPAPSFERRGRHTDADLNLIRTAYGICEDYRGPPADPPSPEMMRSNSNHQTGGFREIENETIIDPSIENGGAARHPRKGNEACLLSTPRVASMIHLFSTLRSWQHGRRTLISGKEVSSPWNCFPSGPSGSATTGSTRTGRRWPSTASSWP